MEEEVVEVEEVEEEGVEVEEVEVEEREATEELENTVGDEKSIGYRLSPGAGRLRFPKVGAGFTDVLILIRYS